MAITTVEIQTAETSRLNKPAGWVGTHASLRRMLIVYSAKI